MMLNMLVGISGSGKSYYAKSLEKDGYLVFSSDAIRKELYGSEEDQTHNEVVFSTLHSRILTALKSGRRVCYDATNLNAKRRAAFVRMLELSYVDCFKKCTVIYRDIEECIEADAKRERSVGIEVIMRQAKQFEVPTRDEGWDGLTACQSNGLLGRRYSVVQLFENLKDYDQGNHHHSLTLGKHLEECKKNATGLCDGVPMTTRNYIDFACSVHDVGKPYTKILNKRGEYSYYGHQNVGAYVSFLYSNVFQQGEMFTIAWLVQNHMEPFFWGTEEQKEKFFQKWGKTRAESIMIIHEADKKAH